MVTEAQGHVMEAKGAERRQEEEVVEVQRLSLPGSAGCHLTDETS